MPRGGRPVATLGPAGQRRVHVTDTTTRWGTSSVDQSLTGKTYNDDYLKITTAGSYPTAPTGTAAALHPRHAAGDHITITTDDAGFNGGSIYDAAVARTRPR